jgi:hypothetical protein
VIVSPSELGNYKIVDTVFDLVAAANGSNGHASQSPSLRSASRVASDGPPVQISIVTAILLCRRMRIATRGWTSSAASSEAQVLRVRER